MPLDPSISLGVRPIQAPNMLGMYSEIAGLQGAQQQNALAKLQYDTAVRQAEDDRATSDAFRSSGGDLTKTRNALTQRGLYKQAMSLDEKLRAMKKDELETATKEADLAKKRLDAFSGLIAPLANKTDVTHDEVFEIGKRAEAMGLLPKGWEGSVPMNSMQLPGFVRSVALSTEQGRKSIEMLLPKLKDAGGSFINENPLSADYLKPVVAKTATPGDLLTDTRTREEGEKNRDLTRRGQNMVDARAKEANAAGKPPAGYRFKADGTLEAIPGGPAEKDKALTEGQGRAALFGTRAQEADSILKGIEGKINLYGMAATEPLGAAGNVMRSENQQKVDQAQRDFVNAVLRQESGAVISPGEFDNAKKQYFPQPGDTKAVIDQKRKNRQTAIDGLRKMAGPGAAPAAGKKPEIRAVDGGYRYKGGDPSKPESWEKV